MNQNFWQLPYLQRCLDGFAPDASNSPLILSVYIDVSIKVGDSRLSFPWLQKDPFESPECRGRGCSFEPRWTAAKGQRDLTDGRWRSLDLLWGRRISLNILVVKAECQTLETP